MINENIKRARKAKGISQEEMAVKLNVVRQTVSKWENGLSVPDADVLIQMADLLEVPVSQLLGVEARPSETQALAEQLAQLNEELAARVRKERLTEQANKKRGLILFLALLSLPIALWVKNEIASVIVFGACGLAALVIYYRNLALLYLAAALTLSDFGAVTGTVVCLYIGIPGLLSLTFYWKKTRGKL